MADTITDLTTQLKRVFNDATTAQCESALNYAHRELVSIAPDIARNETSVSVTSGTYSYDLPADIGETLSVEWRTAASTGQNLKFLKRQQLENEVSNTTLWKHQSAGTPEYYSLESNASAGDPSLLKLILYPKPNTTTSGGYPVAIVTHSEAKTLATSDTIPEGAIAAAAFYRNRALMYLAQELRPDRVAEFKALSDEALQVALRQWGLLSAESTPSDSYPRNK